MRGELTMQVPNPYDNTLQMFVEGVREPDMRHLRFLRWLAERGELEQAIAGPSSGALIVPPTHPMSDLDDDERRRALIHVARRDGRLCAGCGRALADDEPVWWARFALWGAYGWVSHRWAPVGRECARPEALRATADQEPARCAGCGRRVYYQALHALRRVPACSKRCAGRYQMARAREARGS
jgi:hypothetical protein